MSEDNELAPQGLPEGTSVPEENTAATPEIASESGTEETAKIEPPAEPEKTEEKQPWFMKRIHQQSAKIADLARQTESLAREKADLEARYANGEQQQDKPPITQAEIERLVEIRAEERSKIQGFNQACDKTFDAGKSEFPDFTAAVDNLRAMGATTPENIQIVLDATGENSHKVLHQLGKNPEEAERIFSLPPIRMAVELAKLSATAPGRQKPPISSAPAPINPISGTAVVNTDDSKLSDEEWWRRYSKK